MGLPTHIRNDQDQKSYYAKLAEKLADYPNLELMVIDDQLRIILSQCRLIDAMLSQSTGISSTNQLDYEHDLCQNTQTYLNPISDRLQGRFNSAATAPHIRLCEQDLLKQILQSLGLNENDDKHSTKDHGRSVIP